jgi:hypothetical protein
MTVKIHIPSSETPESPPSASPRDRPPPGPIAFIVGGLVAVLVSVVVVYSAASTEDPPDSSIPPPFEPSEEPAPIVPAVADAWTERALPGDGEILAMGTVGDTAVGVARGWRQALIWRLVDGTWQLDGTTDLDVVEAAVVMDDRVLLVGRLAGRPTVWEWIDGAARYLFQPTVGSIAGTWSVGGRLIVAVTEGSTDLEFTIRYGRSDTVWMESVDGDFSELGLVGLETVLAVAGDTETVVIGGRDTGGRAAVGFVQGDRMFAEPLPEAPESSAVTDLIADPMDPASFVGLVAVVDRPDGIRGEIRSSAEDWALVVETPDLVGIEVVDGNVVGVTSDGSLVTYQLDGTELPAPTTSRWTYGYVIGISLVDGESVVYGQRQGAPTYFGPSADAAEVLIPSGRWERYHSEASDGFRLFHIGSLEFSTRDAAVFYRAWNGDRWHPIESDGGLVVFGTPRIVEMDWGFVYVPASGTGLWSSPDGVAWEKVEGSDTVHIDEVATDGETLVGISNRGALGGPTSEVTVVDAERELVRYSLPYLVVGPMWEEGVGFAGTIAPPGTGQYATSGDGLVWTPHDGSGEFDPVIAFDGALYLSSGESVIEGDPPAQTPPGDGWLFSFGETPAFQSASGAIWVHTGDAWIDAGFSVQEGMPRVPKALFVRGSRIFAMVDGVAGVAETYVLDLD